MNKFTLPALCLLFLLSAPAIALIPKPNGYINDFANVIDDPTEKLLAERVAKLKAEKNIEFAIVTIQSLNGADIFEYSLRMAREWGVGSKDGERRGLLYLHSIGDRKSWIQVSRHLEGDFTDSVSAALTREGNNDFKEKKYSTGTLTVVDAVIARATQVGAEQRDAPGTATSRNNSIYPVFGFLAILGFGGAGLAWLLSVRRRRLSREEESTPSLLTSELWPTPKREQREQHNTLLNSTSPPPRRTVRDASSTRRTGATNFASPSSSRRTPKRESPKRERDDDSPSIYSTALLTDYSSRSDDSPTQPSSSSSDDRPSTSTPDFSGGDDYGGGGGGSEY